MSRLAEIEDFVPVIDLAPARSGESGRRLVAEAVRSACTRSGFMVVVGHDVSRETVKQMQAATREFFALPADEKLQLASDPADPLGRGYARAGGPGDDLEAFVVNRLGEPDAAQWDSTRAAPLMSTPNKWPVIEGFRDAYWNYFTAVEELATGIMRIFALALDLPEGWFDGSFERHTTSLAANFYPPRPDGPSSPHRKGEHTDWGTLTLLHRDEADTGLQVLDRGGRWLEVPSLPDSFVVNIGDLMALWTNDRWTSTVHRVVHPPHGEAVHGRYSVAVFHQPALDALIECIPSCVEPGVAPRHEPIKFGDYLSRKARRAYMHRHISAVSPSAPAQ